MNYIFDDGDRIFGRVDKIKKYVNLNLDNDEMLEEFNKIIENYNNTEFIELTYKNYEFKVNKFEWKYEIK